jgi:acetyltransferase EpsM
MKPVYLIGSGRFAAEVCEAFCLAHPGREFAGVFDDNLAAKPLRAAWPHLGAVSGFLERTPPGSEYVIAIGNNAVREKISAWLDASGRAGFTIVHPTAVVSPTAALGAGAYVAALSFIGPNARLGRHALINVGASAGHDCVLGDCVQLCPGARVSGCAEVGSGSFIGSNAIVAPQVKLGRGVRLAAGSFAAKDMPEGSYGVGIPAKILQG